MKGDGTYLGFSCEEDRRQCKAMIEENRPLLLIGSPMCKMHSNLMRLHRRHYSKEVWDGMMAEARQHLEFVTDLYMLQSRNHRYWLHEHPDKASSWE